MEHIPPPDPGCLGGACAEGPESQRPASALTSTLEGMRQAAEDERVEPETLSCPQCDRSLRYHGSTLNGFWDCACGFMTAGL